MFQFSLYFIVLSITKMAISLEPYAYFLQGFQCNIALMLGHTMKKKTDFSFFQVQTHFA